jgi:integrator complex subunit 1
MTGAVKQLKVASLTQRGKVEPILALSLLYLAKQRPQYFNTELIVDALLALLKREVTSSAVGPFKGKMIASPSAIACNLLMSGFDEVQSWPESFIKVFIEDSIGERVWVDREECQGFVENILTAFNTRLPPRNLLQQDGAAGSTAPGSSSTGAASSPSLTPSNTLASLGLDDETSVDSDNSQGGVMRGSAHLDQQQVISIHIFFLFFFLLSMFY